jgi:class III poly(R)-hydroxyalkanoic acid synthase PhaE subunit
LSQPGADPWQHLQREFGKGLEASLAGQSAGVAQPYEFLRGSADLWSRFSELVAGPAAALLRPADAAGEPRSGRDPVRELRNWLDLPGLGILGARQDELRELVRALAAYQEAVNDYLLVMIEIGAAATTRMREAMAERDGDPAVDARALYGLWVECCESAYAERVAEDGFAALYGRLINSGIALRRARQVLIDRWLESAGMPASSTLDGVYRALDRSRREQRRLRERLDALEKTAVAGATAKRTARAGTRAGKEAGAGTERATKKKTAKKTKSTRTVSPTARPRPSTGAASKRPAGRRRSPRKPAAAG